MFSLVQRIQHGGIWWSRAYDAQVVSARLPAVSVARSHTQQPPVRGEADIIILKAYYSKVLPMVVSVREKG